MTCLLGLLGSLLLLGQCAHDQVRGETRVRTDRVSAPKTVVRAAETEEFRRAMAGHWLLSVLPALAGWSMLSWARRQESLDMFSPDFAGLDLVEEAGAKKLPETAEEPPLPGRPTAPSHLPIGRILSALIGLVYVIGAFVSGPGLLSDSVALYAVLSGCLVLIWFPEEIDDVIGNIVGLFNTNYEGMVYSASYRTLIAGAGWFLLVGVPLLLGVPEPVRSSASATHRPRGIPRRASQRFRNEGRAAGGSPLPLSDRRCAILRTPVFPKDGRSLP